MVVDMQTATSALACPIEHQSEKIYAGVDIGGSKIYTLLCDCHGTIRSEFKMATPADKDHRKILDLIAEQIRKQLQENRVPHGCLAGLGVGCAGLVNFKTGIVESSVILPSWHDLPLQRMLSDRLFVRTLVDNDANAAAYGEWWLGAGQQAENILCLTLGTGIGGGMIIHNTVYRGACCTAGEFGHMTLSEQGPICWCGSPGCANPLASGSAMAQIAQAKFASGVSSMIWEMAGHDPIKITAKIIAEAAGQGDGVAHAIIESSALHIGVLVAGLINAFNPDRVVLTGSLMKIGPFYLDKIIEEAAKRAFAVPFQHAQIVMGKLGEASGALGAVGLFLSQEKH